LANYFVGDTVYFNAHASFAIPELDGPYTFSWVFGDGATAGINRFVHHSYTTSGVMTTTLTAYNQSTKETRTAIVTDVIKSPLALGANTQGLGAFYYAPLNRVFTLGGDSLWTENIIDTSSWTCRSIPRKLITDDYQIATNEVTQSIRSRSQCVSSDGRYAIWAGDFGSTALVDNHFLLIDMQDVIVYTIQMPHLADRNNSFGVMSNRLLTPTLQPSPIVFSPLLDGTFLINFFSHANDDTPVGTNYIFTFNPATQIFGPYHIPQSDYPAANTNVIYDSGILYQFENISDSYTVKKYLWGSGLQSTDTVVDTGSSQKIDIFTKWIKCGSKFYGFDRDRIASDVPNAEPECVIFDPSDNSLTLVTLSWLISGYKRALHGCAATVFDTTKILITGGLTEDHDTGYGVTSTIGIVFDTSDNSVITVDNPLPGPRLHHTQVVVGNRILILGGSDGGDGTWWGSDIDNTHNNNNVWYYDITHNNFVEKI
jgi:PKD repeat protein